MLFTHTNTHIQDLVEEDVMILDTYDQVFVWIGRGANEVEKKEALRTARDYIESDPSGRDLDSTLLIQVRDYHLSPPLSSCPSFIYTLYSKYVYEGTSRHC